MAVVTAGLVSAFYTRRIALLDRALQQARTRQATPFVDHSFISYNLTRDDEKVRSNTGPDFPRVSLRSQPIAVILALQISATLPTRSYSVELKTFADDHTLMTANGLVTTQTNAGPIVEIVLPARLLTLNTYYTVYLHSGDVIDHFTFEAVADE